MRTEDVVFHLLSIGLLPFDSVVEGDLRVRTGLRRHRHFVVQRERGHGFFVKTIEEGRPYAAETMRREAACYAYVQGRPELTGLASATPQLLHYDSRQHVLVLEHLGGENLTEHHVRLQEYPEATAIITAQTLARCQQDAAMLVDPAHRPAFHAHLPWILRDAFPATLLPLVTPAVRTAVTSDPRVHATLARLARQWSAATLVHGDMKFDNCVIGDDGQLRFVDWELVDAGDPLWDIAALLQGYLAFVVPAPSEAHDRDAALAATVSRLGRVRPAMRALWSAYRETAAPDEATLERCTGYLGARAVQVAFEHAYGTNGFGYESLAMLHAGLAILADPDAARAEIFDV